MNIKRYEAEGFTLIEILIAITIVGIMLAVIVPQFMKSPEEARIVAVKSTLGNFKQAINLFQLRIGRYPERLLDLVQKPRDAKLAKKWTQPFLEDDEIPDDPWENAYRYKRTPGGSSHPYELYSDGPEEGDEIGKISVWGSK